MGLVASRKGTDSKTQNIFYLFHRNESVSNLYGDTTLKSIRCFQPYVIRFVTLSCDVMSSSVCFRFICINSCDFLVSFEFTLRLALVSTCYNKSQSFVICIFCKFSLMYIFLNLLYRYLYSCNSRLYLRSSFCHHARRPSWKTLLSSDRLHIHPLHIWQGIQPDNNVFSYWSLVLDHQTNNVQSQLQQKASLFLHCADLVCELFNTNQWTVYYICWRWTMYIPKSFLWSGSREDLNSQSRDFDVLHSKHNHVVFICAYYDTHAQTSVSS